MADNRYKVVSWRGWTFDLLTVAMLEELERRTGGFDVFQDSYNEGVEQSAGTHDRGGAVDFWPASGSPEDFLRAAKNVGFFGWIRNPSQGDWGWHIHCGVLGHDRMADLLALQERGYKEGRNGLGSWPFGVDSTPYRPTPLVFFDYKADDMPQYSDPVPGTDQTFADSVRGVFRLETKLDKVATNSAKRDQKILAAVTNLLPLGAKLKEVERSVEEATKAGADDATRQLVRKQFHDLAVAQREAFEKLSEAVGSGEEESP